MTIAQTFTAAVEGSVGWGGIAGIGAAALTLILGYLRGVRLLGPVVGAIEWFRSHGANDLPLDGLGLTITQQAAVRERVQSWLWRSLRDAVSQFASKIGLSAAIDRRVQQITGPLKAAGIGEGGKGAPPVLISESAEVVKRTTGVMAAFRPTEGGPPVLGSLLFVAALFLFGALAPGCVSAEAAHAAERICAAARVIDDAAQQHDALAALPPAEAAAALEGFRGLTREQLGYAEDLVRAAGGDPAEVDRIEAEWRRKAAAKAAERRAAAGGGR